MPVFRTLKVWLSPGMFVLALACTVRAQAGSSSFFVSPDGSPDGNGSSSAPWDLQTALSQPAAVRPGDTIWLRGGTYAGAAGWDYSFSSSLKGSAGSPITVAQYPGERATLDGRGAIHGALLVRYSSWTVFRGFEITDSDSAPAAYPSGLWVRDSNNIKFVNLVIHDMPGLGVGFWIENSDSEIYGCLIYYNGRTRWEHGIYVDNRTGSKQITDNVIFNNYGRGIQGYASSANDYVNNINLDGNVSFNNGFLGNGHPQEGTNLLLGVDKVGGAPALNPQIMNNFTYYPEQGSLGQEFGYVKGCINPIVTNNYFVGATRWANCTTNATIAGNTFYGPQVSTSGPTPSPLTSPRDIFVTNRPTGAKIAVRPNKYESGRANIIVYNWDLQSAVAIDLTGVLSPGASYEIRDAQNFFATPVLSGIYTGEEATIPMSGTPAAPVAFSPPTPSGPEFNVFVVLTTNPARVAPTVPSRPKSSLRGSP